MFGKRKTFYFYFILLWLMKFAVVRSESSSPNPPPHTCVIGAGYSGLATARYFQQYGLNLTIYEAAEDIGGTWRFDPRVGTDEYGVPIFTSQYKYLRTNTPRQTMEFNGFPFSEDTPSYPSGTCFFKYIKSFARKFDLMKYVKLHSYVTSVKLEADYWLLTYIDAKSNTNHTVHCDFVVVANGQYVKPFIPTVDGQGDFEGKIMHSRDYRDPENYTGRNVLLVGAGASGLDLATQLVTVANKLVHSHHLVYNQPDFPENYIKKPDIKRFEPNRVVFEDGSFEEVDTVIYCTGYKFVQPFIHENAELWATNTTILPLHRNIINIKHPTMAFIGVIKRVVVKVLDVQAQYIASLVAGKFQLPSVEQMMKLSYTNVFTLDVDKRTMPMSAHHVKDMNKYFATLTKEAGVDRVPPVLIKIQDFNVVNRLEDLLNYRDYDYQIIDDYNYNRWYNPRHETCVIQE